MTAFMKIKRDISWSILLFILFCTFHMAGAQTNSGQIRISASFDHVLFDDFVMAIESDYPVKFYYAPEWADSLFVSGSFKSVPLKKVLTNLLSHSILSATYLPKAVILTRDYTIRTSLPINFFDQEIREEDEPSFAVFDFEKNNGEKEAVKSTIEIQLIEIGLKSGRTGAGQATLAGHIREARTGEAVIGAVVYVEDPWVGVASDAFGYYSITLPKGKHTVNIQSIGMKNTVRQVLLNGDGNLDIDLEEDVIPLKEVVVEAEKDINVTGLQMGLEKLDIKTIRQMPSALGEADILKITVTLPGVQTVGESASGFNVRGGAVDQNLMLFNDVPIFNTSHLFGFFSVFNPDVIHNVELYKSGIPAYYGGRISSIFDVKMRDGNNKKFSGSGGISPVTGRLTLEGPIVNEKTSFIVGARSTYSDWIIKQIPDASLKNSSGSFFDITGRISHDFNDKNSLYVSGYYSGDKFNLNSDSLYNYNNINASIQWKHIFKTKLYGVFTGLYSKYAYQLESSVNPVNAFKLGYDINQGGFKADFSYFPNSRHNINFGLQSNYYLLHPGSYLPTGEHSLVVPQILEAEQGTENALYISDRFEWTPKFSLYAGLRYSLYAYLGPKTIYKYAPGKPLSPETTTDEKKYGNGEIIKAYQGPECRFSMRYTLNNQSSLKLSFNRMRQYIHMISNTAAISPLDTWKLSDPYIRPQVGDQISLGYYKNFRHNTVEASLEVYYKKTRDMIEYKGGAELILNPQLETDLISGEGKAYGVEVMFKKRVGKLNGWVSYTYSRSLIQANGKYLEEQINGGNYYPTNYDKPHDFTLISNYRFTRRFSFSANFTYSTGRPITYPVAKYLFENSARVHYSDRNQFRIPDYYRLDVSLNLEGNHKIKKLAHSSWTLAVYNLTGRKNVYSIYFVTENGQVNGYKLSIFGQAIPTLTYNFKF